VKQTRQLVKEFKNGKMVIRHPKGNKYHDDYPDSLMMLCWCVNREGDGRVMVMDNPFGGGGFRRDPFNKRFASKDKNTGKSQPKRRFWR